MSAVAAKRECVRQLQSQGLSERRALKLLDMSVSVLRYVPRTDGNASFRERLKVPRLTVAQAKLALATTLGVPLEAIEITIRA